MISEPTVFEILFTSLIGPFLSLLFAGYLLAMLKVFRPKVAIDGLKTSELDEKGEVSYVSIVVSNEGNDTALDCRGCITLKNVTDNDLLPQEELPGQMYNGNQQVHEGVLLSPEYYRSIENELLCWAELDNPSSISIHSGMSACIDVLKVQCHKATGDYYLLIPTEKGWGTIRARIWLQRELHGEVKITAKSAKPFCSKFVVAPGENGKPVFTLTGCVDESKILKLLTKMCCVFAKSGVEKKPTFLTS